jgi:molecular chaperone DnaJ
VPTLSGTKTLRVRPGTAHGTVQRLRGEGPPKLGRTGKDGSPERGDIHYRFVIDVPEHLSSEQEQAIDALSKTIESDPRAGLFPNGAAGADPRADEDAAKAGEE